MRKNGTVYHKEECILLMADINKIKVLSVCTSDVYGGTARAAYRIHEGVHSLGIDSRMFVKNKGSNDVFVHALSEFVPNNPIFNALDWCVMKAQNQIQHARWQPYQGTKQNYYLSDMRGVGLHGVLQKLDYDVLHLHWFNNRFLDIRDLKEVHKPIVWTLHDSWAFSGVCHLPMDCRLYETHCGLCPMLGSNDERDLAYKVFEQKFAVYKDIDLHIVTPSRWLAECAKCSELLGRFPIMVIPNCIDTEVYQPMNKQEMATLFGLNPDKKYLLFGAMQAMKDRNKGFDLLLGALQRLKDIDAELIVYGTDADLSKYEISIPVHSLGYIRGDKQMAMLYNAADVMIVPSRSENLSNTIMESMSCGTPVVAFNIGGNSDMINHEQNGYLAKENDCMELANGIEWCVNQKINKELGKAAREKVLNNYTITKVSKQYQELYSKLCR